MCEPHTEIESASAVAAAASSEDPLVNLLKLPQKGVLEMTLFNARDSFDNLLKGVSATKYESPHILPCQWYGYLAFLTRF